MNNQQIANPSQHFNAPAEIVGTGQLSRDEKLQALENWANELRQLMVAEEENMPADNSAAEQLRAVEECLRALGGESPDHDAKA